MVEGWKKEQLGKICNLEIGGTPSRSKRDYWDTEKRTNNLWVSIRDMKSKWICYTEENITEKGIKNSNAKSVSSGTLLMSFKLTIGRVAIAGKDLYTNEAIVAIVPKDNKLTSKEFLYYYLPFVNPEKYCDTAIKGKTLNKSKLNLIDLDIPRNFFEQSKIAEILTKIDETIEQTENIITNRERIKKGLMQDLFTKGIDEKGNIRSEKRHKFKDVKFRNIKIPDGWIRGTMRDVCKVNQGLQIAISRRFKEEGINRYVYITIQYLNDPERYLEFIENPKTSVVCSNEDILFTRTGNTGQIITNIKGVFHNNFFKVDYDRKKIIKDYLIYFLEQEIIQNLIIDLAGTTTIPDLKHKDFYNIPIYYSPLIKEQNQIVEILTNIDNTIDQENQKLLKLKMLKDGLMQDLLTGKVRVNHLIKEEVA